MTSATRIPLTIIPVLAMAVVQAGAGEDPLVLLREGTAALQRGDLDTAASTAATIRTLIETDARWDPDGSFSHHLVPELEARISRIRLALESLDALPETLRESREEARPSSDPDDLDPYIGWSDRALASARKHVSEIVGTIPDAEDRCVFIQSESYLRVTRLVETEVFEKMVLSLDRHVTNLMDSDERVKALKTKLETLKREVIASSVERERLEKTLVEAEGRNRIYRDGLVEFLGLDATVRESSNQQALGVALAHRIRDRLNQVRTLGEQNSLQKALLLEEIERYRLANTASVSTGAADLSMRIAALAEAVDTLPMAEGQVPDPSMGWFSCCLNVCGK